MSVIAEAGQSPEEFLETRGIDGVSADEVEARVPLESGGEREGGKVRERESNRERERGSDQLCYR
jgi:hypothetical protein